MQSWWA